MARVAIPLGQDFEDSELSGDCGKIPVLVVGTGRMAETLVPLLQRHGHPVEVSGSPPSAISAIGSSGRGAPLPVRKRLLRTG